MQYFTKKKSVQTRKYESIQTLPETIQQFYVEGNV